MNAKIIDECRAVLDHLNTSCNKRFRPLESTMRYIRARLAEGYTVEDCKKVIDYKRGDPWFVQNPRFLNPETLFFPGKFMKYLDQAESDMEYQSQGETSIEERVTARIGMRLFDCKGEDRERWLREFRRMKDGERSGS
jgi:uncharacterized phage protein (TIGR02220 family)